MQSCNLLVSLMDGYMSQLNFDESNNFVFESRVKAVSHQSIALNLLLKALNRKTTVQGVYQKNLRLRRP